MTPNFYGILPASVRYDKNINDKAKLLYVEIACAVNSEGLCEKDNDYFAGLLGVDPRTIARAISQLIETAHVKRSFKNGVRILLVNPIKEELVEAAVDEDTTFLENFLKVFENQFGVELKKKEVYYPKIKERLKRFSEDELISAVKNKADFVSTSKWYNRPENISSRNDVDLLIRDDASVVKWLNITPVTPKEEELKPFKFK